LGLFTASDDGISTDRDYSTDNTSSAMTADGLIGAKYNLASPYLMSTNLRWIFHRDGVSQIRKLKTGDGQYIWQPGLRGDMTDTLLEVPVLMSEYAPNTFTTTLYVGIIGDLSQYWIADAMGLEIQRLVELGAATNQDYFIGRLKTDGMPVNENAFSRVQLG
jgi:HK97 family phage major capsid protein